MITAKTENGNVVVSVDGITVTVPMPKVDTELFVSALQEQLRQAQRDRDEAQRQTREMVEAERMQREKAERAHEIVKELLCYVRPMCISCDERGVALNTCSACDARHQLRQRARAL